MRDFASVVMMPRSRLPPDFLRAWYGAGTLNPPVIEPLDYLGSTPQPASWSKAHILARLRIPLSAISPNAACAGSVTIWRFTSGYRVLRD